MPENSDQNRDLLKIEVRPWYYRYVLNPLFKHPEFVYCTWMDWYKFCSEHRAKYKRLFTVAGSGEFLSDDATRDLLVDLMAPRSSTDEPVAFIAVFDGVVSPADLELLRQPIRNSQEQREFVPLQVDGICVGNHYSIFGNHVFLEKKHRPGAPLEERPGIRISYHMATQEAVRRSWNDLVCDERLQPIEHLQAGQKHQDPAGTYVSDTACPKTPEKRG